MHAIRRSILMYVLCTCIGFIEKNMEVKHVLREIRLLRTIDFGKRAIKGLLMCMIYHL